MKLYFKQIFVLFLLLTFTIAFSIIVVPLAGRWLNNLRITNFFIHFREANDLLIIFIHFLVGYFLVNKIKLLKSLDNKHIILFFFFFYVLISIVNLYLKKDNRFTSLPHNLLYLLGINLKEISFVIGLAIGLFFRNSDKKFTKIISFFVIGLFLIFTKNITLPLSSQHYIYGNFTGKTNNLNYIDNLKLINSKGDKIDLDITDKIIVIDFWNKNCGLCFQKFPIVKKMQEEYKNKNKIRIIAVNIFKDEEDIKTSEKLLKQTDNSNLINYYLPKDNAGIFNIEWYPKTIVIKKNKIIFEGHIEILQLFEHLYLKEN